MPRASKLYAQSHSSFFPRDDFLYLSSGYSYSIVIAARLGGWENDKLETTPLRVVVSYAYLVFSQPPACLHQVM